MSNLLQRLLLFFVGVPAIFAVVWLLPGAHHAATVALVLAFCAGSGLELGRLFVQKGIRVRPALSGALAVAVPLLFYASTFAGPASFGSAGLVGLGLALLAVLVLLPFGLARKEALAEALARAAAYGFILVYPGLLSGFVVLIAAEPPARRRPSWPSPWPPSATTAWPGSSAPPSASGADSSPCRRTRASRAS